MLAVPLLLPLVLLAPALFWINALALGSACDAWPALAVGLDVVDVSVEEDIVVLALDDLEVELFLEFLVEELFSTVLEDDVVDPKLVSVP